GSAPGIVAVVDDVHIGGAEAEIHVQLEAEVDAVVVEAVVDEGGAVVGDAVVADAVVHINGVAGVAVEHRVGGASAKGESQGQHSHGQHVTQLHNSTDLLFYLRFGLF